MTRDMIELADEAACKLDGMFRDLFNQEDRHDIMKVALAAALADKVVYPKGPSEAVDKIVSSYRAFISATPELMSILYDIDMLPEQTVSISGAIRLAAFCQLWKMLPPDAAGQSYDRVTREARQQGE